mmetsp:Transcript_140938/g.351419  ORF Transcript_140938/g.351419 Transcript_140938/m.351419 type:complete len:480 (-) Transcript_140938:223-1662(-)
MATVSAAAALRALPGPPLSPVVGTTLQFVRGVVDGLRENKPFGFIREWHNQYGPVVRIDSIGLGKCVLLGDPELVKYVARNDPARFTKGGYDAIKRGWLDGSLVVSEGEVWRRKRDAYNRAFKLGAIRSYAPLFMEIANNAAENWQHAYEQNETVDAVKCFEGVALEAIGQAGFGLKGLGAPGNRYAAAFTKYTELLNEEVSSLSLRLLPPKVSSWITSRRGRPYLQEMRSESLRIVNEASAVAAHGAGNAASESTRRNLVALMREACAEAGVEELDAEQLACEANLFLFAGHDTTSASLAFTFAMLGSHPEVQQRVYEEIAAIPADALLSELSDPRKLPYLGAVIKETLRLYPPASMVIRTSKFDEEIRGHHVPAGINYVPSIWAIQRDPIVFEAADEFRPERWQDTSGEQLKRMQDHWMPFMIGARGCIGQQFSLMEMRTVLATLLRRFRAELVSEPKVVQRMLLLPENISLRCTPR